MSKSTHRRTAKLRESLERFNQTRASRGLYSAVVRLVGTIRQWLFFRGDCLLLARSLQQPIPTVRPLDELVFRQAQIGDLPLWEAIKNPSDVLWYEVLLEQGRTCVLAFKDNQLVAYGWFTTKVDPDLERTYVPLSQDEIFIFDLFTRPAFRRRGIQSALLGRMLELAQEGGYKRALSLVAVDNVPSLNLHTKLGFQTVCRFTRARFLGWVRFYFRPNPFGKAGDVVRWL